MTGEQASQALPIAAIGELRDDQYVGMIDGSAVAMLRARIAVEGLLTPIWVRRNGNAAGAKWSVIAGRHRLRAAIALGRTEIEAVEKAGPDSGDDELRRLQLAENLDRRVLRPIERSCYIMERWREAATAVVPTVASNQQTDAIRSRWSVSAIVANTPVGDIKAVDLATAAACGLKGERSVQRYRKLYAAIVGDLADLFAALNANPLGESLSGMTTLANIKAVDTRRAAAGAVLSSLEWPNIQAALVAAGIRESNGNRDDPNQPDATVIGTIAKMSAVRRRVTFCELARGMIPTDALALVQVFKERNIVRDNITIA